MNRFAKISIVFLLFLISLQTIGQNTKTKRLIRKYDYESYEFYKLGEFHNALPIFLKLDSLVPNNSEYNYHIGVCYLNSVYKKKALSYFQKAKKIGNYPAEIHYYLGRCYHLNHKFEKAIEAFKEAKKHIAEYNETIKVTLEEIEREIVSCNVGIELSANPLDYKIEHLSNEVNSPYPDYVPVISADEFTLIFTSRRPREKGETKIDFKDNLPYEDIYISKNNGGVWSKSKYMGDTINTETHDAAVGLSPDGRKLFIYHDDKKSKQSLAGNIYSTDFDVDKWTQPIKMPDGINSSYWEPSACISGDENHMFFSSSRPGGKGGLDIYMVNKLPNGDWAQPINLEGINTPYDDDAPFIHSDNRTLYFSSKGHKTMGGFDIFMSIFDVENNVWSEPMNMGYPINTADDDIYFVWTADGGKGYFSSVRDDSYGDKDIYVVHKPLAGTYFMVLKGTVLGLQNNEPIAATIKVFNNKDELGGIYNSRASNGLFSAIIPPNQSFRFEFSANGYLDTSFIVSTPDVKEYFEQQETFYMRKQAIEESDTIEEYPAGMLLKAIYHGFDKAEHEKSSENNLEELINILNTNAWMIISIESHTDSKGSEEYNLKLSERRAEGAKMYLLRRGISKSRIQVKAHGELIPAAPNTKPNGDDNPEGRALNRRTEFIVVTNKPRN